MEGLRKISRVLLHPALLAAVFAAPAIPCDIETANAHPIRVAGEGKQQPAESPGSRDSKCKRAPGVRTVPKGCPDGGERLPNDKRSPLDDAPPLAPLVA